MESDKTLQLIHVSGTLIGGAKDILSSAEIVTRIALEVCNEAGLTVVGKVSHQFEKPEGATCCILLSESHFALHTWPERDMLTFDLFTCNAKNNASVVVKMLKEKTHSKSVKYNKLCGIEE
ncbi:adenosylmethionine decarboxylase [candidate division KSB1 bacterium]